MSTEPRYRIEVHFGHGWEWWTSTTTELDAYRARRTLAGHPSRIIDTHTGRIIGLRNS